MKTPSWRAMYAIALAFNNDGPFGTFFRYICDEGTYIYIATTIYSMAKRTRFLWEGVAVSNNGIGAIDREFFDAIRLGREPNSKWSQAVYQQLEFTARIRTTARARVRSPAMITMSGTHSRR
ncbi:hypothetical protein OH492_13460 [Vibrio chagasii]|nr:hypothetical protein [Vibrio chagasii]